MIKCALLVPVLLFLVGCATDFKPAQYRLGANNRLRVDEVGFNGMEMTLPAGTALYTPAAFASVEDTFGEIALGRVQSWRDSNRPYDYYIYEASMLYGPNFSGAIIPIWIRGDMTESFGHMPRDYRVDFVKFLMRAIYYGETVKLGFEFSVPDATSPRTFGRLTNELLRKPLALEEYVILGNDREFYVLMMLSLHTHRREIREAARAMIASMDFRAKSEDFLERSKTALPLAPATPL